MAACIRVIIARACVRARFCMCACTCMHACMSMTYIVTTCRKQFAGSRVQLVEWMVLEWTHAVTLAWTASPVSILLLPNEVLFSNGPRDFLIYCACIGWLFLARWVRASTAACLLGFGGAIPANAGKSSPLDGRKHPVTTRRESLTACALLDHTCSRYYACAHINAGVYLCPLRPGFTCVDVSVLRVPLPLRLRLPRMSAICPVLHPSRTK